MSIKLYSEENTDICEFPTSILTEPDKNQLTIGDLHANAIKLIYILIKHDIAKNLNKKDFDKLVSIYKKDVNDLKKADIDEFDKIIEQTSFNTDLAVRLIGDELADRGSNDYFVLKILDKIHKSKVPVEILISNHSLEFIEPLEKNTDFQSKRLEMYHTESMYNLKILIDKKIISREEINKITDNAYKPKLKAISYSLNPETNEITVFSHAPIQLYDIEDLAKAAKVEFENKTIFELAKTIDNINEKFQNNVKNNTLHNLYVSDEILGYYSGYNAQYGRSSNNPLVRIMWNRNHNLDRPYETNGYKINYVHGHDIDSISNNNIYNLDNLLGKSKRYTKGLYTVLYTKHTDYNITLSNSVATDSKCVNNCSAEPQLPDSSNNSTQHFDTTSKFSQNSDKLIDTNLSNLLIKAKDLESKNHKEAAGVVYNLYSQLSSLHKKFSAGEIDVNIFKEQCLEDIKQARPVLEIHRGWKQVLGNLALAILGLGVFYIAATLAHKSYTGKFLFFKTDSALKLDRFESLIKSIQI